MTLYLQVVISSSQTQNANYFVGTALYLLFGFGFFCSVRRFPCYTLALFLPCKQQIYVLWQEVVWHELTPLETESFHIFLGCTAPYCLELLAENLTYSVTTIWGRGNHPAVREKAKGSWRLDLRRKAILLLEHWNLRGNIPSTSCKIELLNLLIAIESHLSWRHSGKPLNRRKTEDMALICSHFTLTVRFPYILRFTSAISIIQIDTTYYFDRPIMGTLFQISFTVLY